MGRKDKVPQIVKLLYSDASPNTRAAKRGKAPRVCVVRQHCEQRRGELERAGILANDLLNGVQKLLLVTGQRKN